MALVIQLLKCCGQDRIGSCYAMHFVQPVAVYLRE